MNEMFAQHTEQLAVSSGKIRIGISHRKLWEEFHRNSNEMILTSKGRCIYPRIGYSVEGLEPKTMYLICLKICRTNRARYKYTAGEWHISATGEPEDEAKFVYPDNGSTQLGQYWMNNGIRFGKLKITNSAKDCSSNILLNSMHKYCPMLYIYKVYATPALCLDGSTILTNQYQLMKSFTDEIMEFIAVTAYQNQRIIEMKKIHNSYARGQRGGITKSSDHLTTTTNDSTVPSTNDHSLRLSISPLHKYKPYWTNRSHYFPDQRQILPSIHLLSSNCCNPTTVTCPIASCSSDSNNAICISSSIPHHNSSANSSSAINTPSETGNTSPGNTTISNLPKPSTTIEQRNFLNSTTLTTLNLPSMWNYSSLWHHFTVPYPSLVTHNSPYI